MSFNNPNNPNIVSEDIALNDPNGIVMQEDDFNDTIEDILDPDIIESEIKLAINCSKNKIIKDAINNNEYDYNDPQKYNVLKKICPNLVERCNNILKLIFKGRMDEKNLKSLAECIQMLRKLKSNKISIENANNEIELKREEFLPNKIKKQINNCKK